MLCRPFRVLSKHRLTEQGLVEGRSVQVEARHASGDLAIASRYIDELVKRGTAVFVVPGPAAARLVVQRTAIPVVAIGLVPTPVAGDPYGSLARPGGSVTGFSTFGEELSGKRIELLRRALPRMTVQSRPTLTSPRRSRNVLYSRGNSRNRGGTFRVQS
jgi:putative tryptophan/tyrosine transport system substrate-binding protein